MTVIWKWLWQSCLRMTLPHEPPQKLWDGYRLPEMVQTWDKRWGLPNSHTPFEGWVIGVHIHHYHHCPLNDTTQICHNYIIFVQTYDRRWDIPKFVDVTFSEPSGDYCCDTDCALAAADVLLEVQTTVSLTWVCCVPELRYIFEWQPALQAECHFQQHW